MPNKMLIDTTHPEETRVVVLRGNRVEEFDFESANRKQLRGNIYLAKVTRVEPSLQAAFVDYGGNRHGFLAFSEIHPDYYQIPVADRQALIDEDERAQRAAEVEADNRARRRAEREHSYERRPDRISGEPAESSDGDGAMAAATEQMVPAADDQDRERYEQDAAPETPPAEIHSPGAPTEAPIGLEQLESSSAAETMPTAADAPPDESTEWVPADAAGETVPSAETQSERGDNVTEVNGHGGSDEEIVESVGGADAMEEVPERMARPRRQYKIQEVIKRRQVMLVQVVKEERGTKGAALTTYLSLAGRYSVLMPNTARGGGISRKITDSQDRRRLKEVAQELEVPEGMGVILRTAGASRTKTEVKRDFEYLLRMWETVRDLTLKSTAPTLVYEEGSLIKRSIRDLYSKDIDEILVAGEAGYKEAKDFMRMLMPSHAKNVKPFQDALPIFSRFGIESQLDAMFQPVVQLRSGGYVVLNQTEALVAIDVNSGRATREHHIEDTALKTNVEAAEEIARQLRLRDLAGLIVIDFIDMDEKRNNRTVERRLKEALKHDRARIQVGHISHFGLLEMSRQRIRSSVLEASTEKCSLCGGTGHVRSVSSVALQLLRTLEETLLKGATHNMIVRTRTEVALYLLNHKRAHLRALEERFRITIMVNADAAITGQVSYLIEKGEQVHSLEQAKAIAAQPVTAIPIAYDEDDGEEDDAELIEEETAPEGAGTVEEIAEAGAPPDHDRPDDVQPRGEPGEPGGRGRRRRRRGGRSGEGRGEREGSAPQRDAMPEHPVAPADEGGLPAHEHESAPGGEYAPRADGPVDRDGPDGRRRRRGRRGGRRNRRDRNGDGGPMPSDSVSAFEAELGPGEPAFKSEQPFEQRDVEVSEPRHEARAHEAREHESPPPPAPAAPQPAAEQPSQASPPRRRSTVREPAPVSVGEAAERPAPTPVETPQPVVSSIVESEAAAQPRRSGWWSRRVLGKD